MALHPSQEHDGHHSALPHSHGVNGHSVSSSNEPTWLAAELKQSTVEDKSDGSIEHADEVPKSSTTTSRSQGILKISSTLLGNFTSKTRATFANHSSHNVSHAGLGIGHATEKKDLPANSFHSRKLTELIQANSGNSMLSVASTQRMLQVNSDGDSVGPADGVRYGIKELPEDDNNDDSNGTVVEMPKGRGGMTGWKSTDALLPNSYSSRLPSQNAARTYEGNSDSFSSSCSSYSEGDLDMEGNASRTNMDSKALLESLGDDPSSRELENVASLRIKEILSSEVSVSDRNKWDGIKHFNKMDLVVGKHLGKGTFSDVFEVFATVAVEAMPTFESLGSDKDDLDKLIEAKFPKGGDVRSNSFLLNSLDEEIPEERQQSIHQEEATVNSAEFRTGRLIMVSRRQRHLEKEVDVSASPRGAPRSIREEPSQGNAEAKSTESRPQGRISERQGSPFRRRPTDLRGSVCLGDISRPQQERKVVLAMKCLRPQIRSDAEQFIIGVEDLVHESIMLASIDHPNIIKIHGRAGGCDSRSPRLCDGFFILLDRLQDTLTDRIIRWKNQYSKTKGPPSMAQLNTAYSIADAISYLHSRGILFRDLKPANVGFDSNGVLKLFDFGFAICVSSSSSLSPPVKGQSVCSDTSCATQEPVLLYDRCGTPRYMAPEVGLDQGYSFPSDVYSFGILLWEIYALDKPYGSVKSAEEFHKAVFKKGARPKLIKHWPKHLSDIMSNCWSNSTNERPEIWEVKTSLSALANDSSMLQQKGSGGSSRWSLTKSRRTTG